MTTRTHALLFACLAAVATGCAPNPGPIYISKFIPLPEECGFTGGVAVAGVFQSGGTLDVAPGTPQYFVGIELSGSANVIEPAVTGAGQTIEPANRDRPQINEFVITYSATPKIPNLPTKEYHLATNLPMDSTTLVVDTGVNLLSPEASQALEGIDTGKAYRLLVSVTGNGYMSGSGSHLTTGSIVFPITVTKGEYPSCTDTSTLQVMNTPCKYGGQDRGIAPQLVCCKDITGTGPALTCPTP